MGRDGLLDKFNIVGSEGRNIFDGLFRRPTSIGINTNGGVGDIANGFDDIKVVFRANFDFENGIVTRNQRLLCHIYRRIQPNGKRGMRRVCRIQPQQFIHRYTEHLAHNVIQGHIHGGFRGRIEANNVIQIVHNILNEERVIAEVACEQCDTGQHCFHALAIIFCGRGLAIASNLVC